jgi:imidazole glycerol phosphate synthase glutamine amidotransferase subunit
MSSRIVIIDYGMGNLRNVQKGFERIGIDAKLTRNKNEIQRASAIVLPGVGAFKDCMGNLEKYGLVEPLLLSIEKGKPYLGICLGLQILFSESEEFGSHQGLNLIRGKVVKFRPHPEHKVPHMGVETSSTLCTPTMSFQKRNSGSRPPPHMGSLSFRASGKRISLPHNSTRKKVSKKG